MDFMKQLIASQQTRLAALNYYGGQIDGLDGPLTYNAFSMFKADNGMLGRPLPGPLTMSVLWDKSAKAMPEPKGLEGDPAWLARARKMLGLKETPGAANNPEIMNMAKRLDQWYPGDDVPWCGLFIADCMAIGAPNEPQDFNRLGARNWNEYGESTKPCLGAVIPMWRTHKTKSWNGHVALATGTTSDGKWVRGIGGNQSDMVSEIWFDVDRILGWRVPTGYAGAPLPTAKLGQLSKKEH